MKTNPKVLLVENENLFQQEIVNVAQEYASSVEFSSVESCIDAERIISERKWDIVLIGLISVERWISQISILELPDEDSVRNYLRDQEVGNILALLEIVKSQYDAPDVVLLIDYPPSLTAFRHLQAMGCREVFNKDNFRADFQKLVAQVFDLRCLRHYTFTKIRVKEISVIFADIQGFTRWARDNIDHHERVGYFLDRYLTAMTEVVRLNGGVIDKYIGDAVMAVFDAPSPEHAKQAVEASINIREIMGTMGVTMHINIGINSGRVFEGLFGTSRFYQYTVIGDVVNVAARLQSRARDGKILISPDTYRYVRDSYFDISPEPERAPEPEPRREEYYCHIVNGYQDVQESNNRG